MPPRPLTRQELTKERRCGEVTELAGNLPLLADYLNSVQLTVARLLEEMPPSPARRQALEMLAVAPAWRAFLRGMARRAARERR